MMKRIFWVTAGVATLLFLTAVPRSMAATIVWTNLAGGTWATTNNWSPNVVPGAGDDAYITNNVAFTVTVGATAAVSNFFLGFGPATVASNRFDQNATLTVHGTAWVASNGWFRMSGQLNISNEFNNGGFFQWLDSPMRGNGRFVNSSNAYLQTRAAGVPTLGVRTFNNYGRFLVANDDVGSVTFASNVTFTNHASGTVELDLPCFGFSNGSGATGTLVVNEGLIWATDSLAGCPAYLTVDLLNFGTLRQQTTAWYVGAGTNYGRIEATSASQNFSTVANEPFVFEAGTTFGAITPQLYAGGYFLINAPLTINTGVLHVGDGSGGATTSSPKLLVNADLTVNGDVDVTTGRIEILNPALNVFFDSLKIADSGVVGESRYITNAARLAVNTFQQNAATTDNAGTITIRTNLSFNTGNLRSAGGVIILETNSNSTIAGANAKTFNGQSITNRGTMTATATVSFLNGASWINEVSAILNANGGSFDDTGTAGTCLNFGTVRRTANVGSGGVDLIFTNAGGLVSLQSGTMTIGRFTQTAGRTELRGGNLGGTLTLLGGTLDGAGDVGNVINGATVLPGNALGTIHPTGGYTNLANGVYQMQISGNGSSQYDRITAAGVANLAGTLNVTFTNGFFPTIGNTFTALTWTARSGQFDQILTPNYEFEITYTPTNLLLRASNSLPFLAFNISGGNTQLVCHPFTLSASATDLDGVVTNVDFLMNDSLLAGFAGAAFASAVEIDYPGTNSFVARARDNRGGYAYQTQTVSHVTLPLHTLFLGGVRSNVNFKLCMAGQTDSNYLVLASTNIDLPVANWTALGLMEYTNGIWRYFDNGTITNRPQRFYRALQQ